MRVTRILRQKFLVARARKRFREMTAEPEQAAVRDGAIRRVLEMCYKPVPATPLPSRRALLGKAGTSLALAATATVPAMALSSNALTALAAAPVLPEILLSSKPGDRPGHGSLPALTKGQFFFNSGDGTFAWRDATGVPRRVHLGELREPDFYGAEGNGADDTEALKAFFKSGKGYISPAAGGFYTITGTLSVPSGADFFGPQTAVIKLVLPDGAPAIPMMDTARWSEGGSHINLLGGFTLDHRAAKLGNPTGDKTWVAVGSALILRSGFSTIQITVKNSWDNGIFIVDYDWSKNTYAKDAPPGVILHHCYTMNCGCGDHSIIQPLAGRNGGGIDIADAIGFLIMGCWDKGSSCAVGSDTGGTAYGSIVNCFATETAVDHAHPLNGSGNSFVVQSTGVAVSDLISFFPGRSGLWITGTVGKNRLVERSGDATSVAAVYVYFAGTNGIWNNAPRVSIASCNVYAPSRREKGVYDGIRNECTFEDIFNVTISGCSATTLTTSQGLPDGFMRYEYAESPQFDGHYAGYPAGFPFGDGKPHEVSATIIGGFNRARIQKPASSTYILEAGLYSPHVETAALSSAGAVTFEHLPTKPDGLAKGQLWRDDSTTPSSVRIV